MPGQTLLITLIAFIVALVILVFVHELGHYLVAKWCGVKILRFSIGFGKPLLTWRVGADRTEWCLSALPLGGFVRMLDERDETQLPIAPAELPRAFTRQSLGRRSLIVLAGPVANFILAIALYAGLSWHGVSEPAPVLDQPNAGSAAAAAGVNAGDRIVAVNGKLVDSFGEVRLALLDAVIDHTDVDLTVQRSDGARRNVKVSTAGLAPGEIERDFMRTLGLELAATHIEVNQVVTGSRAAAAGLAVGDRVIAVNGEPINRADRLIDHIRASAEQPLTLSVERSGARLDIPVVPESKPSDRAEDQGRSVGRIGAGLASRVEMVRHRYGVFEGVARGVKQTWEMSVFSLRMLGKMIVGQLSLKNLSGPVSIADYAGQSARIGPDAFISFLALMSVSLGVLNLLPIPVLDGGHLLYYGVEALRQKPPSDRFVAVSQRAGMGIILAMMLVALYNDITRLFGI